MTPREVLLAGIFTGVARITATGVEILILLAGDGSSPPPKVDEIESKIHMTIHYLGQKITALC